MLWDGSKTMSWLELIFKYFEHSYEKIKKKFKIKIHKVRSDVTYKPPQLYHKFPINIIFKFPI